MNCSSRRKSVAFALTSQGGDRYSVMTRMAIASLRLSNPGYRLIVVCDRETDQWLKQIQDPLIAEADEWIAIETPGGDAYFRSRYVKTGLCSAVRGPFLYLDGDVLVRGSLDPIFELDADVAGAANHSRACFSEQVWEYDAAMLQTMGWQISDRVYINTGVLFFNDTDGARELYAEWHQRWQKSQQICGRHQDQPAFNSAIHARQPRLSVLPDKFNAQIKITPAAARDAVLWHYYGSMKVDADTRFELLLQKMMSGSGLDLREIASMQRFRHPWRRDSIVDDLAVAGILRRNRFDGWESVWLRREVRKYIANLLQDIFAGKEA